MMVGQSEESRLTNDAVKDLVRQNIDIIIQMERTEDGGYSIADVRYSDWENKQVA
jgi:Flp pilus assembly CpaF family ATPase